MAIIRPGKDRVTKEALAKVGCMMCTTFRVFGRGKQRGLNYGGENQKASIQYLPKKLMVTIVGNNQVKAAIAAIVKANQTGQPGDGKIFVTDIREVCRIRTGERGEVAVQ